MKVEQHIFQAPHEEVGLRALNNIYQRMQIDTEWSVRGERSFSWWAKDFVQHISVTEPVKGGQVRSAHPTSGPRLDYGHDCLDIIEHLIVPHGKEPSAWTGSDMLDTLALLERYSMMATGDEKGLVAEFPYHGSASLLTFDTDRVHPQVGYGLHVSLKVPDNVFPRAASVAAGLLNQMEAVPELPTKFHGP